MSSLTNSVHLVSYISKEKIDSGLIIDAVLSDLLSQVLKICLSLTVTSPVATWLQE
jgi:hypothetical protein